MFVEFNPFLLLFWVLLSSFLPGAIIAYSILRKATPPAGASPPDAAHPKDDLPLLDKVFIGFGVGIVALPAIPFLLFLLAGVEYTQGLAIASVAVLYAVAACAAFLTKSYEDLRLPEGWSPGQLAGALQSRNGIIALSILALTLIAFWIRLSSYSPVFQELDPYYYTYAAQQILVFGHNPLNDQTSWYPELVADHRTVPGLLYLEAVWYSLYTGSGQYDNMMLGVIASCYPPIAAALAVYFMYIFLSANYKREWAVIGAGIASFVPMFLYKTAAGEMEVQPYAFFALAFFLAMYALMVRKKDIRYAALAGVAYFGLSLGSSSEILATAALLIFIPIYSLMLYFREKDLGAIKAFLVNNAAMLAIGPFLGTALVKSLFTVQAVVMGTTWALAGVVAFAGAIFLIRERIPDRGTANKALAALLIAGLLAFAFTPFGTQVKTVAASGLGTVSYDTALKRTIAEQNPASGALASQIGYIAESYPSVVAAVFSPFANAIPATIPFFTWLIVTLGGVLDFFLGFVSLFVNISMKLSVGALNAVLNTDIAWEDKSNSMLLLWIFLFAVALLISLYRFIRSENPDMPLFVLYAAVVFPPVLVGIMKAKYTIYAGFLLAAAVAAVFAEADGLLSKRLKGLADSWFGQKKDSEQVYGVLHSALCSLVLLFAAFLLMMQFTHDGFSSSLFFESFKVRFQDNPAAVQAKFKDFCGQLKMQGSADDAICRAGDDALAYAKLGTNYQYSQTLCVYSLANNIFNLTESERQAASFRCQRVSDYWIESMEWLRFNTENTSRTTSWWDYGHWINFFGQKNTVLRNEHLSLNMIGEVAHAYIDGTPEDLSYFMKAHNSSYALFDVELIAGGGQLGGKYGALNYLSCNRDNRTNVSEGVGQSDCETEHLWEEVFVPIDANSRPTGDSCTISRNKTGVKAYHTYVMNGKGGFIRSPYYPGVCTGVITNQQYMGYCQQGVKMEPVYCLGDVLMADGSRALSFYYLNETYPNGDLRLNKGQLGMTYDAGSTYHLGRAMGGTMFYTKKDIWLEGGQVVDGYSDRKGKFYDSNLYKAIFLDEIEGFEHVFTTAGGEVKIFKLKG